MSANLPKQSKADIERIKARTLNIKALNYLSVKKKFRHPIRRLNGLNKPMLILHLIKRNLNIK
jgi:hypothetical protein